MSIKQIAKWDSENNFNTNHPELRAGEVWLTNSIPGKVNQDGYVEYDDIGWHTKRTGEKAYCIDGSPILEERFRPVFVMKSELVEAGVLE